MSVAMTELQQIKQLRLRTGLGLKECVDALKIAGTVDAAEEMLRKQGVAFVSRAAQRTAAVGRVYAYVHHNGRCGSLVAFQCETDFAANSEAFKEFMSNICMHAAATPRKKWAEKDIPLVDGKPDYSDFGGVLHNAFLDEVYLKDPTKKIRDLLVELSSKIGEKVEIVSVQRYEF